MTSTEEMEGDEASNFTLRSGTDLFTTRTKDVFAGLGALEEKHSAFLKATVSSDDKEGLMKDDPDDDESNVQDRSRDKSVISRVHDRSRLSKTRDSDYEPQSRSRSREGGSDARAKEDHRRKDPEFRRPNHAPPRFGRQPIPDFKKHPEKYTCYTLADVPGKDMSEKANQKAAFAFLEERRLEREKNERKLAGLPEEEPKFDVTTAACSQGKIAFSVPKNKKEHSKGDTHDKLTYHSVADKTSYDGGDDEEEIYDVKSGKVDSVDDKVKETNDSPATDEIVSNTFKARKNVKRHIRSKDRDDDSD